MKSLTAVVVCALTCPLSAFSAAITDVSITRTVFADGQAGGMSVETVSASASGVFDQKRTDADTNGERSASVTSFQRTNFNSTISNLDFAGAMYVRCLSEGDLVQTIGSSTADVYFTIDAQFNYTLAAIHTSAGDQGGATTTLGLFRVLASGEERVYTTSYPGSPVAGIIGAGRYHLSVSNVFSKSAPEFVPSR